MKKSILFFCLMNLFPWVYSIDFRKVIHYKGPDITFHKKSFFIGTLSGIGSYQTFNQNNIFTSFGKGYLFALGGYALASNRAPKKGKDKSSRRRFREAHEEYSANFFAGYATGIMGNIVLEKGFNIISNYLYQRCCS